MLESRRCYGWGMTGTPGEGFDWRATKDGRSVIGGECMKSKQAAKRAADQFLKECAKYWSGAEIEIIPYRAEYGY